MTGLLIILAAGVLDLVGYAGKGVVETAAEAGGEPAQELLVGRLLQHGSMVCDGSQESRWVDLHHQVGFVRLLIEGELDDALEGALVVAEGVPVPDFEAPETPEHTGPCPMMAMRSDWVQSPSGIRMRRSPAPYPAFRAERIAEIEGLSVRRQDEELAVTFHNRLDRALEAVEFVVHYEGCHGKPGTRSQEASSGDMDEDASANATFPIHLFDDEAPVGRRVHRAYSVQVRVDTPGVAFDLDWPLAAADVDLACPAME